MNTGLLIAAALVAWYFFSQQSSSVSAGSVSWSMNSAGNILVSGAPANSPVTAIVQSSAGGSVSANIGTTNSSGAGTFALPTGFGSSLATSPGATLTLSLQINGAIVGQSISTTVPTSAGTAASGAPVPTQTTQPGNVQTTTPSGALPNTYAAFSKAIAGAVGVDPAVTSAGATPYVLSYYLQTVAAPKLANVSIPLSTVFPGVDLTATMSPAAFWTGVSTWLASNNSWGLTGLRGLGAHSVPLRRWRA